MGTLNGVRLASSPWTLARFRAGLLTALTARLGVFFGGLGEPSVSPLCLSLEGAVGRTLGSILNLNILLGVRDDVPHLGKLVFHQILVEGVDDLQ